VAINNKMLLLSGRRPQPAPAPPLADLYGLKVEKELRWRFRGGVREVLALGDLAGRPALLGALMSVAAQSADHDRNEPRGRFCGGPSQPSIVARCIHSLNLSSPMPEAAASYSAICLSLMVSMVSAQCSIACAIDLHIVRLRRRPGGS
jgi:hypothetical protein